MKTRTCQDVCIDLCRDAGLSHALSQAAAGGQDQSTPEQALVELHQLLRPGLTLSRRHLQQMAGSRSQAGYQHREPHRLYERDSARLLDAMAAQRLKGSMMQSLIGARLNAWCDMQLLLCGPYQGQESGEELGCCDVDVYKDGHERGRGLHSRRAQGHVGSNLLSDPCPPSLLMTCSESQLT